MMRDPTTIRAAALAYCVGVAASVCEFFQLPHVSIVELRALFALVTTIAIGVALLNGVRSLAGGSDQELYDYVRQLSRWVYILMYLLAVVRVGLQLLGSTTQTPPLSDFQYYVLCCVIPLWLGRALVLAAGPKTLERLATFLRVGARSQAPGLTSSQFRLL